VHVWGAIAHDGSLALKIYEKRLNSTQYLNILKKELLKNNNLKQGRLKF
jgi:hypothetical protein